MAASDALLAEGEAWAEHRGDAHALAALYNAYSMQAVLAHGRTERARDVIDKGLRYVAETDDRVLHFALELRRFLMAQFDGHVDDMLRGIERLHSFSREEIDAASPILGYHAPALVIGYAGDPHVLAGRLARGIASYREGIEVARQADALEPSSWLLAIESGARRFQGDFARATALAQESLQLSEQIESNLSISLSAMYLSLALVMQRQFDEATALAERSIELGLVVGRIAVTDALSALARCHLAAGRRADALATAQRAVEYADALKLLRNRVFARLALAHVEASGDDASRTRAAANLDLAEQLIDRAGCRVFLPELFELRADLAARDGDAAAVARNLTRARDLYTEFGAPLQLERLDGLAS